MHKKYFELDRFISAWECDLFIDYWQRNADRLISKNQGQEELVDDFYGRALRLKRVDNPLIHHYMNVIRVRTSLQIKEKFNLSFNEFVMPTNTQIVKWNTGQKMDLHTDTSRFTDGFNSAAYERGVGLKTPYHYRYSALIYLNDEYTGGETLMEGDLSISDELGGTTFISVNESPKEWVINSVLSNEFSGNPYGIERVYNLDEAE